MIALPILLLLIVVVVVVLLGRRRVAQSDRGVATGGDDLLAYLLLAVGVGITVFSLVQLGRAAFPGPFVGAEEELLAAALAGLLVGAPWAVLLWVRQARRRGVFPNAAGWPLYLTISEAVYVTLLFVAAVSVLDWLLFDGRRPYWTDAVVSGAVVVFHEVARLREAPTASLAESPRVVGSAIGLIGGSIGLGGVLWAFLDWTYGSLFATAGDLDLGRWATMAALGGMLWAYRWLSAWPLPPGWQRKTWMAIASVAGLVTTIGAVVVIIVALATYWITTAPSASQHFAVIPNALSVGLVGFLIWAHHRGRIGGLSPIRENTLRSYQYAMAATGLAVAIGGLAALSAFAFGELDVAQEREAGIVTMAVIALAATAVWLLFWSKCQRADRSSEVLAMPRRFYLLGMGVVAGLTAAQALIAALVVIFQAAFGVEPSRLALASEGALAVGAGAATAHLFMVYRTDRRLAEELAPSRPFQLTVVCSDAGPLLGHAPKDARIRILWRQDGGAVITDSMADAILEQVGHKDSIVWVKDGTFEVAAARPTRNGTTRRHGELGSNEPL
ncbi:MAG TPA: DUF5671 domain-containing protein [Acidimicrobiia bacterium]